jgi:recombination protein RecT
MTQLTKLSAKQFFESEEIKKNVEKHLGAKSAQFITSVLSIIGGNQKLQSCEPASIYQSALVATTLDLPINQNLGFAYIVPYKVKVKGDNGQDIWVDKAQFQVGYKGFIQLAQRSGKFTNINACSVYSNDTEDDVRKRLSSLLPSKPNGELIGICGYFKLLNGYEQVLSMSIEELQKHGKKYSKSYSGLWTTDFEAMARKTVIKLLLQRYAPMSIEMQRAEIADQSVIKNAETMEVEYIDNTKPTSEDASFEEEDKRIKDFIENATSKNELEIGLEGIVLTQEQTTMVDFKLQSLK